MTLSFVELPGAQREIERMRSLGFQVESSGLTGFWASGLGVFRQPSAAAKTLCALQHFQKRAQEQTLHGGRSWILRCMWLPSKRPWALHQ